ncbi:hypothetical protein [Streptomyces sp. H27-D2]|uniref:hypothetical protein n=1 Tax=Streptomyces sp. H27-D2 TaxID=3046304 RepID=UPI002DB9E2DB|nr:hypothetical protein [Streptomyces sp. H27-D2]MEC4019277.1 hypothetical protein [Streptomyces sp. H27-D2]
MAASVPVRCPVCRREQSFTPPTLPCSCGAPLTLPLLPDGVPAEVRQRTWRNSWVTARCQSCGREEHWPQPELGCGCGALLRLPVAPLPAVPRPEPPAAAPEEGAAAVLRAAFQPVTIRTARDAVTAAAQYLRWLGYKELIRTDQPQPGDRPASGVDLRGPGIVAQVDPTTRATGLPDIECLWLHGRNLSSAAVFFSLAGYAADARSRADQLHLPLFVMDLTGTPQPANDPADELIRSGPG